MLTQRLGPFNQIDDQFIDELIEAIKANPRSCDEVWFTSSSGFPKIETHRETAEKIYAQAEKFKKIGVRVSLQIQSTIGHGQYMQTRDNTGLVYEGSPAEHLVGPDGTVAGYCFCWRGENYKKYILELYSEFAKIKPHTFWVDDDFRANNHDPVEIGCFCDNCIKTFNEKHGTSYDREELVNEINYGDVSVREKYIEFIREGMHDLMLEIAKTVHATSPDSYMGYEYCANGGYTGFGFDFIFDAMKEGTGKTPKSRPGGNAYSAHNPNEIIEKARFIDWANFMLPDVNIEKRPEIENLPDIVYGKSIQTTCFETTLYLAYGNDAMSYALLQNFNEPVEYHAAMLEAFAKRRKYWQKLIDLNKNTVQSGLTIAYSPNRYKMKLEKDDAPFEWKKELYDVCDRLWSILGVPMCFKKNNEGVVLLHPMVAKAMTDNEIMDLIGKPVITDGKTIAMLCERGFGKYLNITAKEKQLGIFSEQLIDHAVNAHVKGGGTWVTSFFVSKERYQYELHGENIEPMSKFITARPNVEKTGEEPFPYGIASAITTTEKGAKWSVHGEYPWSGIISFDKRNQFISIANYISGTAVSAILETPIQAIVMPRENANGEITSVSVLNKTVGDSGVLTLKIKNPAGKKFKFMTFKDDKVIEKNVKCTMEDNCAVLKVPSISGWGIGTVYVV